MNYLITPRQPTCARQLWSLPYLTVSFTFFLYASCFYSLLPSPRIVLFCPLMFSGLINNFCADTISHKFLPLFLTGPVYWDWGGCWGPRAPKCGVTEREAVNQTEGKIAPLHLVCPPLQVCLSFTSVQQGKEGDDGGERGRSCEGQNIKWQNDWSVQSMICHRSTCHGCVNNRHTS